MDPLISKFKDVFFSFHGVFNTYKASELEENNSEIVSKDFLIISGNTDFNNDKIKLKSDFKAVKVDIAKSWASKEELVY